MKTKIKSTAIFMILLSSLQLFASNLEGVWNGMSYDINFSDSFGEIDGSWGDIKYDLDVDSSFNDIDGTIAGKKVDLNISSSFKNVQGILPCGTVDYSYRLAFTISGTVCSQKFDIRLNSEEELIPTAQAILLEALLADFPLPAKAAASSYVLHRIKFLK